MNFARHPFESESFGAAPSWVAICENPPMVSGPLTMSSIYAKYGVANRGEEWTWAKVDAALIARMKTAAVEDTAQLHAKIRQLEERNATLIEGIALASDILEKATK